MIHARGLTKTFKTRTGPVEAVRGVDLDVAAGEIVGFLGPNGAGKTTTQKMLTTLLVPTAGSAVVAGQDLLTAPPCATACWSSTTGGSWPRARRSTSSSGCPATRS